MTTSHDTSGAMNEADSQKAALLAVRSHFFDELLEQWSHPPQPIDKIMGQDEFFLAPDFASSRKDDPSTVMIKDVERGILAVSVTPKGSLYPNKGIRLVYSLMQAGDWIRFGFLVQGDPKLVLQYQQHHDHLLSIERIWDRQCDYQFRDSGGMLVEWRFKEPDFYKNYVIRERFKLITRHLHFRLGRSILSVFDEPWDFSSSESDHAGHVNQANQDDNAKSLSFNFFGSGPQEQTDEVKSHDRKKNTTKPKVFGEEDLNDEDLEENNKKDVFLKDLDESDDLVS